MRLGAKEPFKLYSAWSAACRDESLVSEKGGSKLNREEKQKAIDDLKEKFTKAKALVVTEYKGMTVTEMADLRDILRDSDVDYKVVKNTLAKIAAEGTDMSGAKDHFKGPIGVAIGYRDAVLTAKGVIGYSVKNDKLKVMGGVVDGRYYAGDALKKVSELPSKEVLLSILAGTMNAPATKLACALSATITKFAFALNSLKEKKAQESA